MTAPPKRLFLYIDILGFSDMIKGGFPVDQLYQRIDDLNVHRDKDFTTIVFSDTIVVYGSDAWANYKNQAVMWLAEFAQDLFFRFIGIDKHFRAFITEGEFAHNKMKNIEAYYGNALVRCYEAERYVKACGIFLDNDLVPNSDIFHTTQYNDEWSFMHIMQGMSYVASTQDMFGELTYPIDNEIFEGIEHWLSYECRYLEAIHGHARDAALHEGVRDKFRQTWELIAARNGTFIAALERSGFDLQKVLTWTNWTPWMRKVGTPNGFFG